MGKEITVWPILSGASLLASLHLQCFLFCSEDKHGALVWGRLCADVFHTEGGLARSWTKGRILNYHVICKVPLWIPCVWFSSLTGITLSKGKSSRTLESENDPTVCVWAEFLPLAHARACYHWCEWETKVLTVSFSQWESFPWCPSLSLWGVLPARCSWWDVLLQIMAVCNARRHHCLKRWELPRCNILLSF